MPRRFITKIDIDVCADSGEDVIVINDLVTVTDAAREHARERGVRLERTDTLAPAPTGVRDDPPSASAVRAAVIAALGTTPDDLDAAIQTVLRRQG